MTRLGAKHAILTAKHGCGFDLWPTDYVFPNGDKYGYDVGASYGRDVLTEYAPVFSITIFRFSRTFDKQICA